MLTSVPESDPHYTQSDAVNTESQKNKCAVDSIEFDFTVSDSNFIE